MVPLRLRARRCEGSSWRISCSRRLRESGPICGEEAPIRNPTASTAASGRELKATAAIAIRTREFTIPASRITGR